MPHDRRVGVITNDRHGAFQSLILEGIHETARAYDYQVAVDSLVQPDGALKRISLQPEDVDGLLVIANAAPRDYLRSLDERRYPLTLISHQLPNLPTPALMFNNEQGIELLVRHLVIDRRRQQLVFVRGIPDQLDGIQREAAFRQELMRYNLPAEESRFLDGEFTPERARESIRRLIDSGISFDSIVAADYVMAKAVAEDLPAHGIAVPEQVSVVGFGDAPEAEQAGITTVAADVRELGKRAFAQLMSQMNGLTVRGITTLRVQLVVRQSS